MKVACTLAATIILYVVSYYMQVKPSTRQLLQNGTVRDIKVADYRVNLRGVNLIFGAMQTLDQKIRPEVWESKFYLTDDVQYFAPSPEFKLAHEAAKMKAAMEPQSNGTGGYRRFKSVNPTNSGRKR